MLISTLFLINYGNRNPLQITAEDLESLNLNNLKFVEFHKLHKENIDGLISKYATVIQEQENDKKESIAIKTMEFINEEVARDVFNQYKYLKTEVNIDKNEYLLNKKNIGNENFYWQTIRDENIYENAMYVWHKKFFITFIAQSHKTAQQAQKYMITIAEFIVNKL